MKNYGVIIKMPVKIKNLEYDLDVSNLHGGEYMRIEWELINAYADTTRKNLEANRAKQIEECISKELGIEKRDILTTPANIESRCRHGDHKTAQAMPAIWGHIRKTVYAHAMETTSAWRDRDICYNAHHKHTHCSGVQSVTELGHARCERCKK